MSHPYSLHRTQHLKPCKVSFVYSQLPTKSIIQMETFIDFIFEFDLEEDYLEFIKHIFIDISFPADVPHGDTLFFFPTDFLSSPLEKRENSRHHFAVRKTFAIFCSFTSFSSHISPNRYVTGCLLVCGHWLKHLLEVCICVCVCMYMHMYIYMFRHILQLSQ